MTAREALDRCLEALYEAALDDALWPATAALIAEAIGTVGNALVVGKGLGNDEHIYFASYSYRGEPRQDLVREYFDVHYPHDTGIRRLMGRPDGRLVPIPDLYTADEQKTSPVYNEILRRMGVQNGLYARIDGPDGLRMVWGTGDRVASGGWRSDQLALIERLRPHIRHFVVVRQALAAADALGATLTGLLDNSRIGVLHLDRAGRVLAANAPALDVLRRGDALSDKGGTLSTWLPADHQRLQHLLARALPRLWSDPPSGGSMTLRRLSDPAPLGLHISPVGDPQADIGGRRVAALVLVIDPMSRPRIDPARVAQALGLTPAEGRVASLLAEGNSVREIAAATGHRLSYVRTLLIRIYRKQGVAGQLPLVQRILALESLPRL